MKRRKFQKVTKDQFDQYFEFDVDLVNRTLWIGSAETGEETEPGTDAYMAERVIKGLNILETESHEPIILQTNNPGGDELHGMAIFDRMRDAYSFIKMEVYGQACSMGSIILQAADERIMAPNALLMLHYGTALHADSELHALEQQMWTKQCEKFRVHMEQLYLDSIRKKIPSYKLSDVKKLLAFGTVFSAREAVAMGLADRIKNPVKTKGKKQCE